MNAKMVRVRALVVKEFRQIVRDPSSIAIAVVLPVMLILLFGYGLSFDIREAPIAVVDEDGSPDSRAVVAAFQLSPYFAVRLTPSAPRAEALLAANDVGGLIRIRPDFARHLRAGDAEIQVLVTGTDANNARLMEAYASGAIAEWSARSAAEGQPTVVGPAIAETRMWFNDANDSHYFLVPGLIVLVMTLIGSMLTALVMAREWERGTMEALFVTPLRPDELLLGKTIPYFVLGLLGLVLCLAAATLLFHVPFRGSVWMLAGVSMLYLLVALSVGLLISSAVKNQFLASQIVMITTFLPAFMLSGLVFDFRSMPAAVRAVTYVLPARYYVALLQTIFLAGDVWSVILPATAVLGLMAAVLLLATRRVTRKVLE